MIFFIQARAGGDGNIDGKEILEGADQFLDIGEAEVAGAADRDDGVVDLLPNLFIGKERALE